MSSQEESRTSRDLLPSALPHEAPYSSSTPVGARSSIASQYPIVTVIPLLRSRPSGPGVGYNADCNVTCAPIRLGRSGTDRADVQAPPAFVPTGSNGANVARSRA